MKAAVYRGRGEVSIEEVPEPGDPGVGEVTIAVSHAAVCGTDAGEWDHGPKLTVPPVILGHEFAGEVVVAGDGVEGFVVGDRVASGAGISCGLCEWCQSGRTNLCADYRTLGLDVDGGLADYVNVPVSTLRKVPEAVSLQEASLAQPFAVAIHGVKRSGVRPGQRCVVVGVGGIGAFVVAACRVVGVEDLVAVDLDELRLETAATLGAMRTVNSSDRDLTEVIRDAFPSDGPDVVIEASGAASAPAAALSAVRRGGRVLLVGLQSAPREIDLFSFTVREVDLVTTVAHVVDDDLEDALRMLEDGSVFDTVVDRVIGLGDLVDQALRPLAAGRAAGKIVVDLSR